MSTANIIAEAMPSIKNKAILEIEHLLYKAKYPAKNRKLVAAFIFKECINNPMSVSDDYGEMIYKIEELLKKKRK